MKLGFSDYGVVLVVFIKGLILGLLIYHFLLAKWAYNFLASIIAAVLHLIQKYKLIY